MQARRYKDHPGIYCNAQMTSGAVVERDLCDQYRRAEFIKDCDGKIKFFGKSVQTDP